MSEIVLEAKEGWDWIRLALGRANAVGPGFLSHLDRAMDGLEEVEPEEPARPLILTGEGSVFSAGLELPKLIEYDRGELLEFLRTFDRVFMRFACLPRPTIAAVNGHAVAGGAVLLLACDWRVGASAVPGTGKPYSIGLKESAIGLPLPRVAAKVLRAALGRGSHELEVALTGELYDPEQALRRGLLNRVVPPEELVNEAEMDAARFSQPTGRAAFDVKRDLKPDLYEDLGTEPDHAKFIEAWFAPGAQRRIREVVESLRR